MIATKLTHSSHFPQDQKVKLVDLGVACLARGEWAMVVAITTIIRARRWHRV
jgi:hypothetical protein